MQGGDNKHANCHMCGHEFTMISLLEKHSSGVVSD